MDTQVVDRTISIFEALANRSEPKGARNPLAQHLQQLYGGGERNEHRLTMEGLSFLENFAARRDH